MPGHGDEQLLAAAAQQALLLQLAQAFTHGGAVHAVALRDLGLGRQRRALPQFAGAAAAAPFAYASNEGSASVSVIDLATDKVTATLKVGRPATLPTSMVVREDSLTIFGFLDDDEKRAAITVMLSGPPSWLARSISRSISRSGSRFAMRASTTDSPSSGTTMFIS